MPRYVVKDSSARMPSKVKAPYRRVAIMEMQPGYENHTPTMISLRAKGVQRVVYNSGALHARGPGCAWVEHYHAAHAICQKLNSSLAIEALKASADEKGLQDYIRELLRKELG